MNSKNYNNRYPLFGKTEGISCWDEFISTGFYSGYWPWGPGTAGAFLATALWVLASIFLPFLTLMVTTAVCIVLFTLLSIPAINHIEKVWGEDPGRVVVDEMVGTWICLLLVPEVELWSGRYWIYVLAAFLLFRLFDMTKPFGIRRLDQIPGGWGVMVDDIVAGIYGAIVMIVMRWLGV